ncbi:OsmC family protein [Natrarchaeobius oligotrophus]|uniref:OsmC family protein n=1 Tax=Natrarchaeobius oligotrophus TaxID=3455743 RepID=UPI001A9DA990|nr:OsmC family protein [Natrarchaeobius chitinivorans]
MGRLSRRRRHTVAEERGIDLDGVEIEIQGDLDPRTFLGAGEDVRAGYQELEVRIDDDDADREALDALATVVEERCPVGDNIEHSTPTNVTVEPTERAVFCVSIGTTGTRIDDRLEPTQPRRRTAHRSARTNAAATAAPAVKPGVGDV